MASFVVTQNTSLMQINSELRLKNKRAQRQRARFNRYFSIIAAGWC
jgi:hypothetical protein